MWSDSIEYGGYLLNNGASLCEVHHKDAENNVLSCNFIRECAGIKDIVLPCKFDTSQTYTKWGKIIKPPARYSIKYPHTPYLNISPGRDEADIREGGTIDVRDFDTKPFIITVKMDGSNIFMDNKKVAARNGYDATHTSYDMIKATHAAIKDKIPEEIQVFCEWLYAEHSIHYSELDNYCQVFAVYNRKTQEWLSWMNVKVWAELLEFPTVRVLYNNTQKRDEAKPGYVEALIKKVGKETINGGHEGVVIRNAYSFPFSQFNLNTGKYVRKNHVTTDDHWSQRPVIKNEVKK